jgi:hypothetical protein
MLAVWRACDEEAGPQRRTELIKALEINPRLLLVADRAGQVVDVILATTDGHRRRLAARGIQRLNVTIRRGNAASMTLCSSLGYEHEAAVTIWVKTLVDQEPSDRGRRSRGGRPARRRASG